MPKHADILSQPQNWIAALQAAMNGAHFAAMPMLAILITQRVEGGAAVAGTALAVYFALSRIGPIFLAGAVERFGLWRGVSLGLYLRGFAFIALPFATQRVEALAVAAILGLGQAIYEVSLYGVIGQQPRAQRDRLLVLNDQALNLGCVLGPVSGAALALWAAEATFVVAGVTLIALGFGCIAVRSDVPRVAPVSHHEGSVRPMLRDGRFLLLCVALVPFWAVFAQLFAAFPLLAASLGDEPAWANAILIVNGLAGIVALACLGPWIESDRTLRILCLGLVLAFATIAGTAMVNELWVLLAIVAIFSIGESFVMLAGHILTARHAEGRSATAYFGAFKASAGVGAALGAYVGVVSADVQGGTGFLVLGTIGLGSMIGVAFYIGRRSLEARATT